MGVFVYCNFFCLKEKRLSEREGSRERRGEGIAGRVGVRGYTVDRGGLCRRYR